MCGSSSSSALPWGYSGGGGRWRGLFFVGHMYPIGPIQKSQSSLPALCSHLSLCPSLLTNWPDLGTVGEDPALPPEVQVEGNGTP